MTILSTLFVDVPRHLSDELFTAIFCYDLMNEPVVPVAKRKGDDWQGPAFAGEHFVQLVTLDQEDRTRPDIARQ